MSKSQQIIENILKNNLVEAKQLIEESLLSRVGEILETKIEEIAPSMVRESSDEGSEYKEKDTRPRKRYIDDSDDNNKKKKKNKKVQESISDEVIPNQDDDIIILQDDDEFNNFIDQIQEIVEEIEQETGEELTEEEIIALGKEYLNLLNEEFESEVELENEIEDEDEDEGVIEEKKDLPGNQEAIDVAEPKGTINGADFKKLRSMRGKK